MQTMKSVILKIEKVKLFQNSIGVKRDLQLGNVASGVAVERTVAFDEGVVILVAEGGGVYGCSTARVAGGVPLPLIGRNLPLRKD